MKSKLFELVGIKRPGRVNLYRFGTVNLAELDDEKLLAIYKAGNTHYLRPTPEGIRVLYPEQITVKPNPATPPGTPKRKKRT